MIKFILIPYTVPSIEKIRKLVPKISADLRPLTNDYCIIGSSAICLLGIDLPVEDLDILTSTDSARKLKQRWKEFALPSYHPANPEKFRSEFGRYRFPEMEAEVMGDLEVFRNNTWERVMPAEFMHIHIGGSVLRIPTLAEQQRILVQLGRPKDLDKAAILSRQGKKMSIPRPDQL